MVDAGALQAFEGVDTVALTSGSTISIPSQEIKRLAQIYSLSQTVSRPAELVINARVEQTVNWRGYLDILGLDLESSPSAQIVDRGISDKGFVEAMETAPPNELAFMIDSDVRLERGMEKRPIEESKD